MRIVFQAIVLFPIYSFKLDSNPAATAGKAFTTLFIDNDDLSLKGNNAFIFVI